jgi:hypothetical protein
MPSHRLAAVALLAFATAGGGALAQTTAPASPTVTPAPNCEKPGDPPSSSTGEMSKSAAEMKRNNWTAGMKAYLDCLKRFVDEEKAAAAVHGKAANAAVDEYNRTIKVFNGQIEAQKQQQ